MIDRGRTAVAAVEESAFGGTSFDDVLDRTVLEGCVAAVVAGPWWRDCGSPVRVGVPRRGSRSSNARVCADGVEVRLADEQLTLATAAHELAHALAGVDQGHGPVFRIAHIDVTALLAGRAVADVLADTYAGFGLPIAARSWPAPFRALGDGFVLTAQGQWSRSCAQWSP